MFEYRITKYNPENRNVNGFYIDKNEWTDFSDIPSKVTLKEYEKIEESYINTALEYMKYSEVDFLKVENLEDYENQRAVKENELIPIENIFDVLKSIMRNKLWCKLTHPNGFIHFGYDFYMYIGIKKTNAELISKAEKNGLFVEIFNSPYS